MKAMTTTSQGLCALALAAMPMGAAVSAQDYSDEQNYSDQQIDVFGQALVEGPDVEGVITARRDNLVQITAPGGQQTVIEINEETDIRAKGGFLGLSRKSLGADSLMNGLPVSVETMRAGDALYASRVRLDNSDLEMAEMIRAGTAQGFAEQTAATEALGGRVGDIDKYSIKGTTNVYFGTNEWSLSGSDEQRLCSAVNEAGAMDNALLLVVGYTDADGPQEYNQILSERRAGRVVNHIQQACGWQPWRMLTPTGMAEADPAADNMTEAGKAQNRRVAVNILVSKATEGL